MCNGENGLYLFIKHVIFDQIFILRWIRSLKKPYFSLTFDWFFLSTVILKIALFGHDINEKRNQKAMILEVQTNKYTKEIPSRISWPIYERLYHYWIMRLPWYMQRNLFISCIRYIIIVWKIAIAFILYAWIYHLIVTSLNWL